MTSTSARRWRWGIIGTGTICRLAMVDASLGEPRAQLVCVAGRTTANTRAFAAQHKIPEVAEDAAQLLGREDLDAVYIATPNSVHEEQVSQALSCGLAVLVEKPAWLPNLSRAQTVQARAEPCQSIDRRSSSGLLREALMMRHHRWQSWVGGLIASKEYGQLQHFELALHTPIGVERLAHLASIRANLVQDLGPHALQIMQMLSGTLAPSFEIRLNTDTLSQPQEVSSKKFKTLASPSFKAKHQAYIGLNNNLSGLVSLSYVDPFQAELKLFFDRGQLIIPKLLRPMIGSVQLPYELVEVASQGLTQGSAKDLTKDLTKSSTKGAFPASNYYVEQLRRFIDELESGARGIEPGIFERQRMLEEWMAA